MARQLGPTRSTLNSSPLMLKKVKARFLALSPIFLLTVVLPTLLSIAYFGIFASDVYISESRFVVRSPERQSTSPLGSILKGAGFAKAQDDTYTVHDYIASRDALAQLQERLHFREAFSREGIDLLSRFSALDGDKSFEALHRYYQKKVEVTSDASSSISTLTVRAFTADDSVRINEQLIEMSEALVNRLNERGRRDLVRFAGAEVEAAERRVKEAANAVSAFRSQQVVMDPERQAQIQLQQVAKLQDELISTTALLNQLRSLTPDNPQIAAVARRVENLRKDIDGETRKATGGERSLAGKSVEFQRLNLERDFAEKQLASAMVSLEQARNDALRQQLYLERIVQPSRPDVPVEPRRVRAILITFALGLVACVILSLLIAGVREHHA